MADVIAVRMQIEQPDILLPVLLVSFGFLTVIVGLLSGLGTFSVVLIGLGVVAAAVGTLMILLSKVKYVLSIEGSDGKVQALTSRDKDTVAPIVDAIGEVLVVRGH
jgi:hypothetical protein